MWTYEVIEQQDITAVARMERTIFSDAWSECGVADTAQSTHAFILGAKYCGELKGYCVIYYAADEADLARIAVDASVRKQGVGRQLLETAWNICKEKGIRKVLLEVRASNFAALHLYKQHDFKKITMRKEYYKAPVEDGIVMQKELQ